MSTTTATLDVREDIRAGREPFAKIMQAVAALQPNEDLLLIAPFEPVPLFHVLSKRGFQHAARKTESGDWQVTFTRASNGPMTSETAATVPISATPASEIVEVDARGLEPPQPLVKILERAAVLPDGAELRAWTDRRPMHLYGQLAERGFSATTEEQPNGFITYIRRA